MCKICIDLNEQKISLDEAFQNLYEISDFLSKKHFLEITNILLNELKNKEIANNNYKNEIDDNSIDDFWHNDQEDWMDFEK